MERDDDPRARQTKKMQIEMKFGELKLHRHRVKAIAYNLQ